MYARKFVFTVLSAFVLFVATAGAQDSSGVRKVGSIYNKWSWAWDIATQGSYAYVAAGNQCLVILDISNPVKPVETGFALAGFAGNIAVSGDFACVTEGNVDTRVADNRGGMWIMDISDPFQPFLAGYIDLDVFVYDVAVEGKYAYLAGNDHTLRVVDISDPSQPLEVGRFQAADRISDIFITDDVVYLADGWGGLQLVDVSNRYYRLKSVTA